VPARLDYGATSPLYESQLLTVESRSPNYHLDVDGDRVVDVAESGCRGEIGLPDPTPPYMLSQVSPGGEPEFVEAYLPSPALRAASP
jgi:hypothetical protein